MPMSLSSSLLSLVVLLCILSFSLISCDSLSYYTYQFARADRFSPPQAIPFSKNASLSTVPPACYQKEKPGVLTYSEMSEQCLYLSFWAPEEAKTQKLPIMVFIHGGSFVNGAISFYNGSYIAKQGNVIVVSIQYRLGMLGFSAYEAFETDQGVGNLGLLDQIEALKFVKQNLAQFGGDTDRITIVGESAGGISVQAHQAVNRDEGLFHRAITMSGTFAGPVVHTLEQARKHAAENIQKLNCELGSSQQVVECLKSADPKTIVEKTTPPSDTYTVFPTIDNVLIKKPIAQYFKDGDFNKVPSILGTTQTEFSPAICKQFHMKMDYITIVGALKAFFKDPTLVGNIVQTYNITDGAKTNYISDYVHLAADFAVHCPTRRTIASIAEKENYSYFYTFGHKFGFLPECYGASHAMDLPLLFPVSFMRAIGQATYEFTEDEKILGENMVQFFSNFAATGNVNSRLSSMHGRKPLQCFFWSPYTPDTDMDMYFEVWDKIDRRKHFYEDVCALWDKVPVPASGAGGLLGK